MMRIRRGRIPCLHPHLILMCIPFVKPSLHLIQALMEGSRCWDGMLMNAYPHWLECLIRHLVEILVNSLNIVIFYLWYICLYRTWHGNPQHKSWWRKIYMGTSGVLDIYFGVWTYYAGQFVISGQLFILEWPKCLNILGQPRRHLLQSGWSVFVSSKRLVAGDAFIFLRFAEMLMCSR